MRIELDRPRCEGHGLCEEAAPRADAPRRRRRTGDRRRGGRTGPSCDAAKAAVRVCPVAALRLAGGRRCAGSSSSATASPGSPPADSLRRAGFDGELTVVGDEQHRPTAGRPCRRRCCTVSTGKVDGNSDGALQAHELPEPTHEATELLGVSATGLDVDARLVRLDGGGELPYDGLVIASGSRAKRLAAGARDREGTRTATGRLPRELTLRTIEDAILLKERVASRPSVIVIGGGPLGMEVASGCVHVGCEVTLVSDGKPLSRQLGDYLAGHLHLRRHPARTAGGRRREGPACRSRCRGKGRPGRRHRTGGGSRGHRHRR